MWFENQVPIGCKQFNLPVFIKTFNCTLLNLQHKLNARLNLKFQSGFQGKWHVFQGFEETCSGSKRPEVVYNSKL